MYKRCKRVLPAGRRPFTPMPEGRDPLAAFKVEKRNASGEALCPQHLIAMTLIKSEELRAAIKRLRPELPGLLDAKYSIFTTELDSFLDVGSDEQVLKLFSDYPAAHKRLLEILL